jgi:HK97 family phage prohead protease
MKEVRSIERSLTASDRVIEGYALIFNSESVDLGGFREIIDTRALDGVIEKSDVFCVLNHDIRRGLLARSNRGKGSLELIVDGTGLKYRFIAPKTALGDELVENVERSDISGSSFSFCCGADAWTKEGDGRYIRRVLQINEMYDVSPVYCPAYGETKVSVDRRGLEALIESERRKAAPPAGYYAGLRRTLKKSK